MAKADLAARGLLREFRLDAPPVDPFALAEHLGVLVVPQHMDDDVSGMLLRKDGACVIGVNQTHSFERRRFTVAHELGHLRLHEGRPLILDTDARVNYRNAVSSMATDREEIDANRFAAALLAPEDMVRRAAQHISFRTTDDLVRVLVKRFQMSEMAMTYRLMNLGIVSGPAR